MAPHQGLLIEVGVSQEKSRLISPRPNPPSSALLISPDAKAQQPGKLRIREGWVGGARMKGA